MPHARDAERLQVIPRQRDEGAAIDVIGEEGGSVLREPAAAALKPLAHLHVAPFLDMAGAGGRARRGGGRARCHLLRRLPSWLLLLRWLLLLLLPPPVSFDVSCYSKETVSREAKGHWAEKLKQYAPLLDGCPAREMAVISAVVDR